MAAFQPPRCGAASSSPVNVNEDSEAVKGNCTNRWDVGRASGRPPTHVCAGTLTFKSPARPPRGNRKTTVGRAFHHWGKAGLWVASEPGRNSWVTPVGGICSRHPPPATRSSARGGGGGPDICEIPGCSSDLAPLATPAKGSQAPAVCPAHPLSEQRLGPMK